MRRSYSYARNSPSLIRVILAFAFMILAVVGGLWAGIWWAFIGGIIQLIEAVKAPELEAAQVAFGVARIFFAGLIGWITFVVGMICAKLAVGD